MRKLVDVLKENGHVKDHADMIAKIRAGELFVPSGRTDGEHIYVDAEAEIVLNPQRHKDPAKLRALKRTKI